MKQAILAIILTVELLTSASAQVLTGDLTNGLVAYYSFNGNANDSVGGNNGTLQGNASFATDDTGFHINLLGKAISVLSLQGVGNVTLSTVPINLNADFSVNFWCYGDPAGNGSYVDGSGTNRVDNFISTGLEGSGGLNIRFSSFQSPRWQCFSGNVANIANPFIGSDQPEYVSAWNFVSYIQSGNTTELFINGSLAASMSNTPVASSLGTLTIGYHNSADPIGAYYMYGKMSDLSFYNTALSSFQVSSLYGIQSVPEPSTYALFGIGAIGMLMVLRKKKAA